MQEFCTRNQIVAATGLATCTVWRHKQAEHLKAEVVPGARGLRFRKTNVEKWLNLYYPEKARRAMRALNQDVEEPLRQESHA